MSSIFQRAIFLSKPVMTFHARSDVLPLHCTLHAPWIELIAIHFPKQCVHYEGRKTLRLNNMRQQKLMNIIDQAKDLRLDLTIGQSR